MDSLISIVFLNYNRLDETRRTISKLRCLLNRDKNIEIIAVDNASTDGTTEYLASAKGSIKVILLDKNYGIGGYNRGFEAAKGEIIIVLDDDSHIEYDSVKRVRECFSEDDRIGIIAFRIIDGQGTRLNTWHIPLEDSYQESPAFVGCGFAARRDVFQSIGFYPKEFFLYHNEIFVAAEVRRRCFKVMYDPQCVAIHRTQAQQRDPARRIYYTMRNSLILIWTYYPISEALYMTFSRFIISFALAARYGKINVFNKALADFLKERIKKRELLKHDERKKLQPFFIQNSILHRAVDFFKKKSFYLPIIFKNNL